MNCRNFLSDTEITLTVTQAARHSPNRLMDLGRGLTKKPRRPDTLNISSRILSDEILNIKCIFTMTIVSTRFHTINSKSEYRNPKQILMTKIQKFQTCFEH